MTSKTTPPVPPANRSPKGTGDEKRAPLASGAGGGDQTDHPDQRGQTAATKQNTTHQGYQQDR
ncbi:hypothetical protein [Hansschlegelia sp.]|uniref:hypothetical protein n=1 Tax=Hansschlegelia sp. TaxID=2041892 RepID=UPI002BAF3A0D|nr:hypothetical protein [Hansschlegelia sp.]HVI28248.1 hypothetical protein [Hansschlegelia sp.]